MKGLRCACRQLLKSSRFAAVAVFSLASGTAGRAFADLAVRHVELAPRAAKSQVQIIRSKLLPWRPDVVFTGHGVRTNGTEFITKLVQQTELSLDTPAGTKPH